MSDDRVMHYFQVIRQHITALQRGDAVNWHDIDAALEDLQILYEQMQSSLEAAEIAQEGLLQQNQRIAIDYYHYHELFQSSPIPYFVMDENGVILEGNHAIAQLLNLPQHYLTGKPLALYVAERDRSVFRTHLNQLSQKNGIQVWHLQLCPRNGEPFATQWHVEIVRNSDGQIENLRVAVYDLAQVLSESHQIAPLTSQPTPEETQTVRVSASLPRSLDGLRVLVVDDEPDIRDFITAILEAQGISVRTVASAAAALEELDRFRPDVLLSDIRMPDGDGYSLIRQIRDRETQQGGRIPVAAITAYLEEDREKTLSAGFEAHLHKLAQPDEWVEMVAQLARQGSHS